MGGEQFLQHRVGGCNLDASLFPGALLQNPQNETHVTCMFGAGAVSRPLAVVIGSVYGRISLSSRFAFVEQGVAMRRVSR